MAQLTLDLTGRNGLAPRFWGDIDRTTATPNLRYLGSDGQMADGIYNPFRRFGYLSPANGVFNAVTDGSTENFSSVMSCSIYDPVNDDFYLGMYESPAIYKGDGLDDVALTANAYPAIATQLFDLEIYQINGVRKLFYVYKGREPLTSGILLESYSSPGVNMVSIGYIVEPVGSAEPTFGVAEEISGSGSSTTISTSVTVPSGSNQIGVAIVFTYNASSPSSATWNGSAMTSVSSGTGSFGGGISFGWGMFKIAAPTTGAVTGTWGAGVTNRVLHAFVYNAAHQTTMISSSGAETSADSGTLQQAYATTARYQLPAQSVFTQTTTLSFGSGQTEMLRDTITAGEHAATYYSGEAVRLRIGISNLPFVSGTDDWLTQDVSGGFADEVAGHAFMEVADNGFAYIFHDNAVDKLDGTTSGGTNGTISANVLLFPVYFRCIDAIDYRGLMFIGIHQYPTDIRSSDDTVDSNSLKCGVYLWDRLSSIVQTRDYIPIEGIKQIRKLYISPAGKLRAVVINSERVVEIREYNGSTFEPIQEVGYNAYPAFRDSLTSYSNVTTWLGRDGKIYAHGKVTTGEKESLFKIGTLTDMGTAAVSAGAILYGGEDTGSTSAGFKNQKDGLYLSYYNGSNFKVKEWDMYGTGSTGSTVVAKTNAQGDVYTLVQYLPQMSTVKDIELFMAAGSGSGSTAVATLKIYFNQSSTAWASKTITQDDSARGYKRIEINKPFVNSIQLEVEFNTSATIGTIDFAPSFAIVEYEPSNAKG